MSSIIEKPLNFTIDKNVIKAIHSELSESIASYLSVSTQNETAYFEFSAELSTEDQTTFDNIYADIPNIETNALVVTSQEQIQLVIAKAINFGTNLMIEFSAENVLLGITQANKTKEVADYLSSIMRYLQSGSLYEVINEIDRLQAAGLPVELEPFVTTERLNTFKQRVNTYLGQ